MIRNITLVIISMLVSTLAVGEEVCSVTTKLKDLHSTNSPADYFLNNKPEISNYSDEYFKIKEYEWANIPKSFIFDGVSRKSNCTLTRRDLVGIGSASRERETLVTCNIELNPPNKSKFREATVQYKKYFKENCKFQWSTERARLTTLPQSDFSSMDIIIEILTQGQGG